MNTRRLLSIIVTGFALMAGTMESYGQVYGKLKLKAPIFADVALSTMYALDNNPRHQTRLTINNLYSGSYNIQVICRWKDMFRAKDMGTDRSFLIRQGDIIQLDNNLSQLQSNFNSLYNANARTQAFAASVPYCIDPRYAPPTTVVSRGTNIGYPSTPGVPSSIHTVRKKETLYGIGKIYGIPYQEIMQINGLATTEIKVGQRLRIERSALPVATPVTRSPEPLPTVTNTVFTNQPIGRVTTLNVGQAAGIPRQHVMQKGETLSKLSRMYGVSTRDLILYNQIQNVNKIPVGMVINIPSY